MRLWASPAVWRSLPSLPSAVWLRYGMSSALAQPLHRRLCNAALCISSGATKTAKTAVLVERMDTETSARHRVHQDTGPDPRDCRGVGGGGEGQVTPGPSERRQITVSMEMIFRGIGLHSGEPSLMRIRPVCMYVFVKGGG